MQANVNHMQLNVDFANFPFYRDFFLACGWKTVMEMETFAGMEDAKGTSLWFVPHQAYGKEGENDYDRAGPNHIGLGVGSIGEVDEAIAFLRERGIEGLFGTPRHQEIPHRPEDTYYQVMFESPDRILFEVAYIGPKA
jgi:catechol 2,3-dioxygenase-like lactoylglutathione lyase family enzyme